MTKKDYEWLAALLKKLKPPKPNLGSDTPLYMFQAGQWEKWQELVTRMTDALSQKESSFKPIKFMLACGLEGESDE